MSIRKLILNPWFREKKTTQAVLQIMIVYYSIRSIISRWGLGQSFHTPWNSSGVFPGTLPHNYGGRLNVSGLFGYCCNLNVSGPSGYCCNLNVNGPSGHSGHVVHNSPQMHSNTLLYTAPRLPPKWPKAPANWSG